MMRRYPMLRIAITVAAFAALAATADLAAARDGCGSGWYWNGDRCIPTRAERESRDEQRFRDERRTRWWREGTRDFRDNEYRDYTTGSSSYRIFDDCRAGYRRIDGRCVYVGRDRF